MDCSYGFPSNFAPEFHPKILVCLKSEPKNSRNSCKIKTLNQEFLFAWKVRQKLTQFIAKIWACIKSSNWPNSYYRLHEKWGKKLTHFIAKIWACIKIFNWPNSYYMLHEKLGKKLTHFIAKYEPISRFLIDPIAITCCMKSEAKNWHILLQKYEPVSRFLIDPITIRCCMKSEAKIDTFCCKHKIFLLVYTWFSNIVNDSASLHRLIM